LVFRTDTDKHRLTLKIIGKTNEKANSLTKAAKDKLRLRLKVIFEKEYTKLLRGILFVVLPLGGSFINY